MNTQLQLTLLGAQAQRQNARALLENCPQVARADASADGRTLRLTLSAPLAEGELFTLLALSGVSGFRIG